MLSALGFVSLTNFLYCIKSNYTREKKKSLIVSLDYLSSYFAVRNLTKAVLKSAGSGGRESPTSSSKAVCLMAGSGRKTFPEVSISLGKATVTETPAVLCTAQVTCQATSKKYLEKSSNTTPFSIMSEKKAEDVFRLGTGEK